MRAAGNYRRHLNGRGALMSLARAISAVDAPDSYDCSTKRCLRAAGRFGCWYPAMVRRSSDVLSIVVFTRIGGYQINQRPS